MGNQLTCCRQTWIEFHETDENTLFEDSQPCMLHYVNAQSDCTNEVLKPQKDHLCTLNDDRPNHHFNLLNLNDSVVNQAINIQHISEREPEDHDFEPSSFASQHALFFSGIKPHSAINENRKSLFQKTSTVPKDDNFKRWSSCSTVYIGDGCLFHPDVSDTLWSVAVAVELLVRSELNLRLSNLLDGSLFYNFTLSQNGYNNSDHTIALILDTYHIFDERKHPIEILSKPATSVKQTLMFDGLTFPNAQLFHRFLNQLFNSALLGPECAIVSLILLERLVKAAEVAILSWTWRRQLLSCILLASKVLDDQAVWNVDYCHILRDVQVEDLNELERHVLNLLQFNINVPLAVYARYFFDLLSVGEAAGVANLISGRRRLTPERACHLHLISAVSDGSDSSFTGVLFDLPRLPLRETSNLQVKQTFQTSKTKSRTDVKFKGGIKKPIVKTPFNPKHRFFSIEPGKNQGLHVATKVVNSDLPESPIGASPINESPVELDEEAEFINSLQLFSDARISKNDQYLIATTSKPDKCHNNSTQVKSPFPLFNFIAQRNPAVPYVRLNSYNNNNDRGSITHDPHPLIPSSSASNSTDFIRSIMGGDAAYSLLRDTGMY